MIVNKDKLFEAEKMNEKLHSLFLAPHFLYSCFVKAKRGRFSLLELLVSNRFSLLLLFLPKLTAIKGRCGKVKARQFSD